MTDLPDFMKKEKRLVNTNDRETLGHFIVVSYGVDVTHFSMYDFDYLDDAVKAAEFLSQKKNVKLYRSFVLGGKQ